ncbi:MAG: hypothetical protein M3Q22_00055 [Actinomycetota bacterium]|nr:hypothetical protein [Actinomycetota bacterium]
MDLFDPVGRPEQEAYLHRLQAFTASVSRDRGAVVDDPDLLEVAQAVYAAFGDERITEGLTRGQIASGCRGVCDEATFNRRFDVFVGTGMLMPYFDKAHQQRYHFNMASGAGLLVWERLAERGGVNELITLLDHTQTALNAGTASHDDVQASLRSGRRWLTVAAAHLLHLVSAKPLADLIAERRHHNQEALVEKVEGLSRIVAEQCPNLDHEAYRVLQAAQGYVQARESFLTRVLDEGGRARDFSLLDPEEYLEAALTRSPDELAEAFADVVVDPPEPWVDATTITDALTAHRPPPRQRERPPRPAPADAGDDPIAARREADDRARTARDRRIELLLQGEPEADVSSGLRALGWPTAGRRVADLLAAHADPHSPYLVQLADELLVDPGGPVTYLTPLTVIRVATGEVLDAGLDALLEDAPADQPEAPDA